jgi:hypothetical protein
LTAAIRRGTVAGHKQFSVGVVMIRVRRLAGILSIACLLLSALGAPTRAANLLEQNFYLSGPRYDGVLPGCEAGLDTIASRFASKESGFWNSDLAILGFERVREVIHRPWAPNSIPRRFCTALALVSDGYKHPVHYSLSEDTGFLGATWGVEWCVTGLDRNWAYNPACKMARP